MKNETLEKLVNILKEDMQTKKDVIQLATDSKPSIEVGQNASGRWYVKSIKLYELDINKTLKYVDVLGNELAKRNGDSNGK